MIPKIIHHVIFNKHDRISGNFLENKNSISDFEFITWSESDVINIMNVEETEIFFKYKKDIQRKDYSRYVILKYFGGIYFDIDIKFNRPISDLYNSLYNDDTFFEENTISEDFSIKTKSYKIRNGQPEHRLRIANYILSSTRMSKNIQGILDICKERSELSCNEDYDIIYTTGPDVVSEYFNTTPGLNYLKKDLCDNFFTHLALGHWRTD